MRGRTASALLWGAGGSLCFLVFHQAYLLVGGALVSLWGVGAAALLVGAVTALLAYWLEVRTLQRGRQ